MSSKIHVLGNGDMATLMPESVRQGKEGKIIACNQPPLSVKAYATAIVDFKMCKALHEGSVNLDSFMWVCGNRPKMYCGKTPAFYMKHAHRIREFYTDVPKYCGKSPAEAATNFNCGHMATHYAARRHEAEEVHLYGFDSLFDHNMRSYTDLVLNSDRGNNNNHRLIENWRPIWNQIFAEFKNRKFVLWHKHDHCKVDLTDNVEVNVP